MIPIEDCTKIVKKKKKYQLYFIQNEKRLNVPHPWMWYLAQIAFLQQGGV